MAQAAAALSEANEAAEKIERDAQERARQLVQDAEERAHAHRIEAEAGVRARLDAIRHHEHEIRDRLESLSDAVREAAGSLDGSPVEHLDLEAASLQ